MTKDVYLPPETAPLLFWGLATGLAILALGLTPEVLIALGPLRQSLSSDVELTRRTAELTVLSARVLCGAGALALLLLGLRWRAVVDSRWMRIVCRHTVPSHERAGLARVAHWPFRVAVGTFAAAAFYIAFVARHLTYRQRRWLAAEDGALEQATALLFLAASLCAAWVAIQWLRRSATAAAPPRAESASVSRRRATWHALLALFFFFCFGEEISWGQRVLGFETSEAIAGLNVQEEMNIHNMFGYLADHLFIAGTLVYGAALPLLAWRYEFWRRALHWVGLPLASVGLALGFCLASSVHGWTLYRLLPEGADLRPAELRELLTGLCFAMLMAESLRWVNGAPEAATADAPRELGGESRAPASLVGVGLEGEGEQNVPR